MPQLPRHQHRLLERFAASLGADVRTAPRLLIAVSGGADSMALLELTALARGALAAADLAVYVDHRLRSEADKEAAHVRVATERLGLGFALARLDATVGADEGRLREARYGTLQKLVDQRRIDFVLTGHTREDQIETVLHRLVRGAGRHGLGGIPRRRANVVRPLLGFRRQELREFLKERGVGWREDPSNDDLGYLRNRLRHRVIPVIETELGPNALDHLPALASTWREEEAYLESEARRYAEFALIGPATNRRLDARALRAAPAALRPRIARAWLAERTGRAVTSFSRTDLAAILGLAESVAGTRRIALDRIDVVNAYGTLDVALPRDAADAPASSFRYELATHADGSLAGPGGWTLEIANLAPGAADTQRLGRAARCDDHYDFDRDRVGEKLIVRSGRPGDRLHATPRGHRKVSDLMVDARVPVEQRASWPVVEAKGRVVWIPGLARSEDFAVADSRAHRVRLSWRRELA